MNWLIYRPFGEEQIILKIRNNFKFLLLFLDICLKIFGIPESKLSNKLGLKLVILKSLQNFMNEPWFIYKVDASSKCKQWK